MAPTGWTVARRNGEIRIDVTDADAFARADLQEIADAIEKYLADERVTTVRLDGPVLEDPPLPVAFTTLAQRLAMIAQRRGLRLHVGPI